MKKIRLLAFLLLICLLFCACQTPGPSFEDGEIENEPSEDEGGQNNYIKGNTVFINEVCAKSTDEETECFDWIELYNDSNKSVDISGWWLSDSKKEPARFVFPEDTIIGAHGYVIVWATGGVKPNPTLDCAEYYTSFKISNEGETLYLSNPKGEYADVLNLPGLSADQSWGRSENGNEIWATMDVSPYKSNEGHVITLAQDVMTFSHESGFYSDPFSLTITAPLGFTIYYTTDCTSARSLTSTTYSGSISVTDPSGAPTYSLDHFTGKNSNTDYIDKCFVVRAVAMDENGVYTQEVTKSYFVGYETKDGYLTDDGGTYLPIISMTTDPNEIYSKETGLFPNYSKEKYEKEVNFTYLDESGNYLFDQQVGIRIRGSSTRNALQKNLNVYARGEYDGNSQFPSYLFPDASFTKSIVLRSDNRWNLQLGQDFLQDIVKDRDVVTQDSFPVIVFIDGEYFGIYSLYERVSEDFLEAHYGVDDKEAWIVKFAREENAEGALDDYLEVLNLLTKGDLTSPAVWNEVCARVDMQSLIDLFCIHIWYDNGDFCFSSSLTQNISAWRASPDAIDPSNPYADGKWRFILFDLDYAMDGPAQTSNAWERDTFHVKPKNAAIISAFIYWDTVQNLMKSATFNQMFATTFIDLAENNFHYNNNVKKYMKERIDLLYPCILPYLERFNYKSSSGKVRPASDWSGRISVKQTDFMENRATYIIPFMESYFPSTGKESS